MTVAVTLAVAGSLGSPTVGGTLPSVIVSVLTDVSLSPSSIVYLNTSLTPPGVPGVRA